MRAPPDGYTLLMTLAVNAINAAVYDNLSFNFIRDTAPVASIASIPLVMEVNPSVPAKTVPEFIAYAKANPGKLTMASVGNGTTTAPIPGLAMFIAAPPLFSAFSANHQSSDTQQQLLHPAFR